MLESVGTVVGGGVAGGTRSSASARAPDAVVMNAPASNGVVAPMSPRVIADPVAGVMIMEYLSSTGEKSAQLPSSTVVAYLRSGLSEDGLPVRDPELSVEREV